MKVGARRSHLPLSGRRLSLGLMTAASIVGGSVLLIVGPAGATSVTYMDPRPCSASVQNGICISSVSVDYGASSITLSVTVGTAADPNADPNWQHSYLSDVTWFLSPAGGSSPSYEASVSDKFPAPDGSSIEYTGVFAGAVENLTTQEYTCDWTNPLVAASFSTSSETYSMSFPPTCLGNLTSLSAYAVYSYDTSGGTGGNLLAYASPSSGFCCSVTPDVAATSTTSSSSTTTTSTTASTTTTGPTPSSTSTPTMPPRVVPSSIPSSQLAFTGPGSGLRSTAVAGAGLLVLGLLMLVVADTPRRLGRLLASASIARTWPVEGRPRSRRESGQSGVQPSEKGDNHRRAVAATVRRGRWLLGR